MTTFTQRHLLPGIMSLLLLTSANAADHETIAWIKGYDQGLSHSRAARRPALVYFQAPWCSWCHVYERDTLGDPRIIDIIRRRFVPVLVNYDARPDLLKSYRGFGLPFTVILDADGKLLARLPGILNPPDMLQSLQQIVAMRQVSELQEPETLVQVTDLGSKSYQAFITQWLEHLEDLYEPATGTFTGVLDSGATLKRSAPRAWTFMLEQNLWPDRTKRAAQATLDNLYDPRHGGFFYFRDPHRSDEHLETAKMLDANAWLIHWFAQAGRMYRDTTLLDAARDGGSYLREVLWDRENGGFIQAQVSDAGYYKQKDGSLDPPALDRIKRTDSNAQAAVALMEAAQPLNDDALLDDAIATVNYLLRSHLQDGQLYHSRSDAGFGPVYNLPEDIFWLLAATQAATEISPFVASSKKTGLLYQLANQWLLKAMQPYSREQLPNELLGIIAWVAVNSENPLIPRKTTAWALRQLRIESTTRPDELIYALKAWHKHLTVKNGQ
ncbi:MAG: thioredoxin family protein [Pseudomonadota bacterium]